MAFCTFLPVSYRPFTAPIATTPHAFRTPPPPPALAKPMRPLLPRMQTHTPLSHSPNTTTIPAATDGLFSSTTFASLGLSPTLVDALTSQNLLTATTIQKLSIPAVLGGASVLIGASTGSGKTLAYLLPLIDLLKTAETLRAPNDPPLRVRRRPRALILVPTRELSDQILTVARTLSHIAKFSVAAAVGGPSRLGRKLEQRLDTSPVDVLVATTGRLLQLVRGREIDVRFVRHVVIDEVDTMFDQGFGPEVMELMGRCSTMVSEEARVGPQMIGAGATHPRKAVDTYQQVFREAKRISADLHKMPVGLEQRFVRTKADQKMGELMGLVRSRLREDGETMVFCNTVESCRFVEHSLREAGFRTGCVHGEMPGARRDEEYNRFVGGEVDVMVCTDVTGRGVDLVKVGHVILFDFPGNAVDYVHRAGRTARAGMKGRVTSLVTKKDEGLAAALERAGRGRGDALESEREVRAGWEEKRKKKVEMEERRKKAVGMVPERGRRGARVAGGRRKSVTRR